MKKLRTFLFALLIALLGAANVFADVPDEPIIQNQKEDPAYWVIALAVVLIAAAVAIWLAIRARRKK